MEMASVALASPAQEGRPPQLIRSIFYYNQHPELGTTVGLHFFEPRYRILVQRCLREPQRGSSFVFLPNFDNYEAAHGDVGYLAKLVNHRLVPGKPGELPRADVTLKFVERVLIQFHWVEQDTGGLSECVCVPLPPHLPSIDDLSPVPADKARAWDAFDWQTYFGGPVRVVRAAPWGHPCNVHWLLHADSTGAVTAALAKVRSDFPLLADRLYPVLIPPATWIVPLVDFIRRLAALHIRNAAPATLSASAPPFVPASMAGAEVSATADAAVGGAASAEATDALACACASASAACASAVDAATARLPTKELRQHLKRLSTSEAELQRCIEREDLLSLLRAKLHQQRNAEATVRAVEPIGAALMGMEVPVVCGSPAAPLVVRECSFSRQKDGRLLRAPAPSELWGAQANFRIDERNISSLGQLLASVYAWELSNLTDDPDEILTSASLRDPDERDGAMLVALSCVLKLGAPDGCSACMTVSPNLCWVPRAQADRTLLRTARKLNWVRVRLLFERLESGLMTSDDV